MLYEFDYPYLTPLIAILIVGYGWYKTKKLDVFTGIEFGIWLGILFYGNIMFAQSGILYAIKVLEYYEFIPAVVIDDSWRMFALFLGTLFSVSQFNLQRDPIMVIGDNQQAQIFGATAVMDWIFTAIGIYFYFYKIGDTVNVVFVLIVALIAFFNCFISQYKAHVLGHRLATGTQMPYAIQFHILPQLLAGRVGADQFVKENPPIVVTQNDQQDRSQAKRYTPRTTAGE